MVTVRLDGTSTEVVLKKYQVLGTVPSGKPPKSEPYRTVPCRTMQWKSAITVPSLMLLAQKKHHIHSLTQITPPFLGRCPVAVKPCLRLSPHHLMHTGYRSIQLSKICPRDSQIWQNDIQTFWGGGGLGEEHLRDITAKAIIFHTLYLNSNAINTFLIHYKESPISMPLTHFL